jgi:hypothetical protein
MMETMYICFVRTRTAIFLTRHALCPTHCPNTNETKQYIYPIDIYIRTTDVPFPDDGTLYIYIFPDDDIYMGRIIYTATSRSVCVCRPSWMFIWPCSFPPHNGLGLTWSHIYYSLVELVWDSMVPIRLPQYDEPTVPMHGWERERDNGTVIPILMMMIGPHRNDGVPL